MNKVALYMRISVEEFGERIESESISSQRLLITDYILKDNELRSYEKVEYIDDGYSGTNLDIQFKSLLYDFYSKDVSDKVKTSMTIQKKQGKYLAWSPPYGYMKDPNNKYSIVVDEVVAPVVKKIFSLYLDGLFTRKIARIMNEEGNIVPSIRKKQLTNMDYSYNILDYKGKKSSWTNGTITDILMNENYTGTYVFNMQPKTEIGGNKAGFLPKEEWERVPNHHEAIISIEDFEKVRKLKEKNQFMEKKNTDFEWYKKFPLQSIVRCSTCGHILTCQTTRRKKKDGSPYELF